MCIRDSSHAEGSGTTVSGIASHAEGSGTIASGNSQHVQGTFNIADTTSLAIIGNGTSNVSRSNLMIFETTGTTTYGTAIATTVSATTAIIGLATSAATGSVLTVNSRVSGFMPPRMTTTERDLIATPSAGLIIYNETTSKHQGYNGSIWNDFY